MDFTYVSGSRNGRGAKTKLTHRLCIRRKSDILNFNYCEEKTVCMSMFQYSLVFGCEKQRVKVNESVFMIGYCFKPIAMSLLDCYYEHWNECMYCRRVLQSASLIPNASIALICALAYNQHNHKMDLVLSIWRTLIDIHNTHTHSLPVAVVVAPFACFSLSQKKTHTHTALQCIY